MRRVGIMVGLLALAPVLVGCGGDNGDDEAGDPTSTAGTDVSADAAETACVETMAALCEKLYACGNAPGAMALGANKASECHDAATASCAFDAGRPGGEGNGDCDRSAPRDN